MASSRYSRWLAVSGAILVAAIAADSLVPVAWQVRLGLHWLIEHFLAYFVVTTVLCLAFDRPLVLAATLAAFAALMEALQGFTSDRVPDLATAFCGAAGAMAAGLLAPYLGALLKRWQRGPPQAFGR